MLIPQRVQFFATPWIVACQAPLSMEFSGQEYWNRLPFPSPGDLPDPGIKPKFPTLAGGFFTVEPLGKPWVQSAKSSIYFPSFHLCSRQKRDVSYPTKATVQFTLLVKVWNKMFIL